MAYRSLIQRDIPLSSWTTLGVGGAARYFARIATIEELRQAFRFADGEGLESFLVGGGSNLVVADEGYPGLVIHLTGRSLRFVEEGATVRVEAEAGVTWDDLVRQAVERGLAGLECLSGIPGTVGAAPIQNIGAYGQEASDTLTVVQVLDRASGSQLRIDREECGFGYRTSRFKRDWKGRFVITGVEFRLGPCVAPTLRYDELKRRAQANYGETVPSLAQVRDLVLAVRRDKSMLHDVTDPNGRSAGSFFLNPVVDRKEADRLGEMADCRGWGRVPGYPGEGGQVKVSAAWLIEHAGFPRGYVWGQVGLSTRHALAIINRGGARAAEVVDLARRIRASVLELFGVCLAIEPELVGFEPRSIADLIDPLR